MRSELADMEAQVALALETDDRSNIDVLGYGEISTVLRLEAGGEAFACKRLPPFPGDSLTGYRDALTTYLAALGNKGIVPATSTIEVVNPGPSEVVYCIQPMEETLLVDRLRGADLAEVEAITRRLVATIAGTIDDRLGVDAQLSNWALRPDGTFVYLDVTTPMVRNRAGEDMLDFRLVIASLPAFLRPVVHRFLLGEILSHYYSPRAALLDLVGNLKKERLEHTMDTILSLVNEVVDPPITRKEIDRYYRMDALMWEVLQRLRLADRWWQRRVRRRRYPFLLPGKVDR